MADFTIDAEPRVVTGKKVGALRRTGFVPVTVYGPHMQAVSLQVPYRPLELALLKAGGSNLIELKADGSNHTVLVRDVQRNVITREILHVDFFALDLTQKLRTDVPIQYVGESPAVAAKTGILITGANALHLEMLPSKLIDHIEVDVSALKEIGDSFLVKDLDLGEDITIHNDPEELLARITPMIVATAEEEAEEAAEAEEAEGAEPEVITKGKGEEEEEF